MAVIVALLIGFTSVFSAVVAWRASLASIESSRLQSLAVQEQARQQQLERQFEGSVAQDERMAVTYQEHVLGARELLAQADAVRQTNPEMADELDLEAHGRSALARALLPYISSSFLLELQDDGTLTYDREAALTFFRELNVELRELQPEQTSELAQQADTRTISLIAVAAVLVAALFFLTIAQVVRSRIRIQQAFALLGALFIAAGTVGFVFVEVLA